MDQKNLRATTSSDRIAHTQQRLGCDSFGVSWAPAKFRIVYSWPLCRSGFRSSFLCRCFLVRVCGRVFQLSHTHKHKNYVRRCCLDLFRLHFFGSCDGCGHNFNLSYEIIGCVAIITFTHAYNFSRPHLIRMSLNNDVNLFFNVCHAMVSKRTIQHTLFHQRPMRWRMSFITWILSRKLHSYVLGTRLATERGTPHCKCDGREMRVGMGRTLTMWFAAAVAVIDCRWLTTTMMRATECTWRSMFAKLPFERSLRERQHAIHATTGGRVCSFSLGNVREERQTCLNKKATSAVYYAYGTSIMQFILLAGCRCRTQFNLQNTHKRIRWAIQFRPYNKSQRLGAPMCKRRPDANC